MSTYSVSKSFSWQGQITKKVASLMRMFGLTVERLAARSICHKCAIEINEGDVVYITGPSGAGKSVLLRELYQTLPGSDKGNLDEIELPADGCLVDCIEGDLLQTLKLLSTVGLSDVFCMLARPAHLSDGQKYRFRLAMALAAGRKFIFADEFCSNLDRITAAVLSYNVRRHAKRNNVTFILASSHEDVLADLVPDILVRKELSGPTQIIYKESRRAKSAGVVKR